MKTIFILLLAFSPTLLMAADLRGRLGLGFSNQLANDVPAISLKIQQSKTFAMGGVVGFKSNQDNTLYGAGLKFYRIIFDEPQLNFYLAGLLATENYSDPKTDKTKSGYQVDGTLGTEFHFSGLESIGFSFEFGVSARNTAQGGSGFQTLGDNFLKAAVHFYL
ncbi:MAG: hypothetical protein ACJ76H_01720 [Bacteriovoracaceae bacterium]